MATTYLYEFRDNGTVLATGRLSRETPLEIGDTITINGRPGVVSSIAATLDRAEKRVLIQPQTV